MFDMMGMEQDLDSIENESGNNEPAQTPVKDLKKKKNKKKKQAEPVDVQNDKDSAISENGTEDDTRMEPVKRKLDSKVT